MSVETYETSEKEYSETPEQEQKAHYPQEKLCPDSPDIPGDIKCPPDIPPAPFHLPKAIKCSEYDKIEDDVQGPIDLTKKTACRTAYEAFKKALDEADDAREQAEAVYNAAERKWNTAKENLIKQKSLEKEKLEQQLKTCRKGYCPPEDIPCDKDAICITQVRVDLAKIDKAFITDYQKFKQEWDIAINTWNKAENDYKDKRCLAKLIKNQAELEAELAWRKEMSSALQNVFKR